MSRGWSFSLCLIAILSTNGLVWGQLGNTLKEEPEKPFLQPYSPVNNYQNFDASHQTINNNTNKYKHVGKTPNKVMVSTTKKSAKSILEQDQKSEIQRASPKIGISGSSPSFQGYSQSISAGSGSFLDGYLLKSLHEKGIVKKKGAGDKMSDETLPKKKKDSFFK